MPPEARASERHRAVRYAALGDSYTIGTSLTPDRAFPARLAERWRARGREVELRNLGVNGYTTDDLIREELPRVRAFAPTLVTLLIGANDIVAGRSAEAYRAQLRRIVDRLFGDGVDARRLVLMSAPDWSTAPRGPLFGEPALVAALVDAYAEVASEEAERAGLTYFDVVPLSRAQASAGKFAPDGLHYGARAYEEWATALDAQLGALGLP